MITKKVVLLGKTNVGKSSIYNVLTKGSRALVSPVEHVTRDALIAPLCFGKDHDPSTLGFCVEMVDLAGFDFQKENFINFNRPHTDFYHSLKKHVFQVVDRADLILALFDLKNITTVDREMIAWIKNRNIAKKKDSEVQIDQKTQPVFYVFNKVDNEKEFSFISEAYDLGVKELFFVSAKSKKGLNDLTRAICSKLYEQDEKIVVDEKNLDNISDKKDLDAPITAEKDEFFHEKEDDFSISIIGKPNGGKSSLLNVLLKTKRALVSDMPGTTRDSIVCDITWEGIHFTLFDTAGMRRKSQKKDKIEESSIKQSIKSIKNSSLSLLLVDATLPISEQDKKISAVAFHHNKALIVVFNKWDLVQQNWNDFVDRQLFLFPLLKNFILLPLSTKTGYHVSLLKKKILSFEGLAKKKYGTPMINCILQDAIKKTNPPAMRVPIFKNGRNSKNLKYKYVSFKPLYATCVHSLPFVVKIFCRHTKALKPTYENYLIRNFRDTLSLKGVPIRLIFHEINGDKERDRNERDRSKERERNKK